MQWLFWLPIASWKKRLGADVDDSPSPSVVFSTISLAMVATLYWKLLTPCVVLPLKQLDTSTNNFQRKRQGLRLVDVSAAIGCEIEPQFDVQELEFRAQTLMRKVRDYLRNWLQGLNYGVRPKTNWHTLCMPRMRPDQQ